MILSAVIIAAVGAALMFSRGPVPGDDGTRPRWARSPVIALAFVTCAIYLNQVLFTVYVLRVRDGDASFISRYLPEGWFAIARGPAVESFARHFPAPELLAPTVLRVQAFLELPFVTAAYLTACHWFSPQVYRRVLRLAWPISASYTATFCLVEWELRNPYTLDDIALRLVAAILVPLWVARLSRDCPDRAHSLPGLLTFAISTAMLGILVLVVYETALLYNLGNLGSRLPIAAAALLGLAAARWTAGFTSGGPPGRGIESIARSFGWLLAIFAVPALPLRYGLSFGAAHISAAAALLLIAVAAAHGIRETFSRMPGQLTTWLLQMAATLMAATFAGAAALLLPGRYVETRLLWSAAAFFICAISVCASIDRFRAGRQVKAEYRR